MTYHFATLSPADFEDLARDLVGAHLGCRFEAFGPGPDGGIDGRHAAADGLTVLQAKHYRLSGFASLRREMLRERANVERLAPDRYVLATSVSLTPAQKESLAAAIGPVGGEPGDLLGFEDLNGLLRAHPEVARAHVKLWLSGTAVLERVVRSASFSFTGITGADISAKLRVYAENPGFPRARTVLEEHRVLIVSGPPGVGKTTLAEMLAYAYAADGWELVALRGLEDGFGRLDDRRRQVFLFDDFLGRIALDERALSERDSEFARFVSRIARTPTSRFILTTRAYIYEQARLLSDTLSSKRLDLARFVLDVGIYTRRVRARILFNHLVAADVPAGHIRALHDAGAFKVIVDHAHYNPRIIEWMTDPSHIGAVDALSYPREFIGALDDPGLIWDKAFTKHIPPRCRHLLLALFFLPEHGAHMDDAREAFDSLHPLLSATFGLPWHVTDFGDALRSLEGSFVVITGRRVSFVNPSVRDYLDRYLGDKRLLTVVAGGAHNASAAQRMADRFERLPGLTDDDRAAFLARFEPLCARLNTIPQWRGGPRFLETRRVDMGNSARVQMLLTWWRKTRSKPFLAAAEAIMRAPSGGFGVWDDARRLSSTLVALREDAAAEEDPTAPLAHLIEEALRSLLTSGLDPDDLSRLIEGLDWASPDIALLFEDEIAHAIPRALEGVADNLGHVDSESTLADLLAAVDSLAERTPTDPGIVADARSAIERRMEEVDATAAPDEPATSSGTQQAGAEAFDDGDLESLFGQLIA